MRQSSELLINESPLIVLPSLACVVGLHGAIVLQQVQYWLARSHHEHDGRKWTYNTYEEWHEQFPFWQPDAIRKTIKKLEIDGILLATDIYNKNRFERRKWYSIDYDKLDAALNGTSGNSAQIEAEDFPDRSGESVESSRSDLPPLSRAILPPLRTKSSKTSREHPPVSPLEGGSAPTKRRRRSPVLDPDEYKGDAYLKQRGR